MKFIEIEYVVGRNAKTIKKCLIRIDNILSVVFAHRKNPVLRYIPDRCVLGLDNMNLAILYLTQESYKKIKEILTEEE